MIYSVLHVDGARIYISLWTNYNYIIKSGTVSKKAFTFHYELIITDFNEAGQRAILSFTFHYELIITLY